MPKITVVIPVLDEEELLADTLRSIRVQTYKDYELIVVDNGSTDRSPEIAKATADRFIVEKERGPHFAIHRGILEAQGEFVASCDADTLYPKRWLERMVNGFRREGVVAVYGPMAFRESGAFFRGLSVVGFSLIVLLSRLFGVRFCGSANLGVRKEAYFAAGGYSLESPLASQDVRLVKRLASLGKEVRFLPTLVCYTSNRRYKRLGFWVTFREYFRLWFDTASRKDRMTYDHYFERAHRLRKQPHISEEKKRTNDTLQKH